MSNVTKWLMYSLVALIIVALLRNPAGSVALMLAGGTEANALAGTLSGSGIKAQKGSFTAGTTKISVG